MSRIPREIDYFLGVAEAVAKRGDCTRRIVGCVLAKDGEILSTGFNGLQAGRPGCFSENGCPRGRLSSAELPTMSDYAEGLGLCQAYHAEVNAIASAWSRSVSVRGATAYVVSLVRGSGYCQYWDELTQDWLGLHPEQAVCRPCREALRNAGVGLYVVPTKHRGTWTAAT